MSRLREHYEKVVKPALMKEFGYDNPYQAPRLEKIVVNMGVGEAVQDQKRIEAASQEPGENHDLDLPAPKLPERTSQIAEVLLRGVNDGRDRSRDPLGRVGVSHVEVRPPAATATGVEPAVDSHEDAAVREERAKRRCALELGPRGSLESQDPSAHAAGTMPRESP